MASLDEIVAAETSDPPWYRQRSTWIALAALVIFLGLAALGFVVLGSPGAGAAGGCGGM